ncbi:MAG: glutathione S-transferase family protein [Gammaproteobacteria bacterium]
MAIMKPAHPIRLYGAKLSGHTHRVLLLLNLLELPFETIEINLSAGENKRPEFLTKNPFGQIPVIEDGDTVLYDSNAILVYLATKYDDGRWLPRDALGATTVQRWFSMTAGAILRGPAFARAINVFGAQRNYERAKTTAIALFKLLDTDLHGKQFALGNAPTLADVAAYAYIAHAPEGGVSLDPYPNVCAWLRRIEALPRFVPMPVTKAGLLAE